MDWINILIGTLGVIFSLSSKMYSLQKLSEKASVPFVYKMYFKREALAIVMSFLSIPIWSILFPEIATKYPALETWVRCTFFLMGGIGAWAIQKMLGKTQSWINNKIDEKTNELAEKRQELHEIKNASNEN